MGFSYPSFLKNRSALSFSLAPVSVLFVFISCSGGNNSYDCFRLPEAVAHNKSFEFVVSAQQDEPFFILRMVRIKKLQRMFIVECCACILKENAMLLYIGIFFLLIPLKAQGYHMYIVHN